MLVNTRSDAAYQRYCDTEEQRLHVKLFPVLVAGIRIQLNTNAIRAQAYVEERGQPILFDHYRRIYRDQYNAVFRAVTKEAGVSDFVVEQSRYLLNNASSKITGISTSLRDDITRMVLNGVAEGKSNKQIAREISQQAPEISKTRAATIARTETHNASIVAINETLKFKNVQVTKKTWWTAGDDRVRESHLDVHGVSLPNDEPFDVGDSQMMYPGDESLGAGPEEIVNCRCSILYETEPLEDVQPPPPEPPPEPAPEPEPIAPPKLPEEMDWHRQSWTDAPKYITDVVEETAPLKEVTVNPASKNSFFNNNAGITMKYPDKSDPWAQNIWRHEWGHYWDREQGRKLNIMYWTQTLKAEATTDDKGLRARERAGNKITDEMIHDQTRVGWDRFSEFKEAGATELVALRRALSEILTDPAFTADDYLGLVQRSDGTFSVMATIRGALRLKAGHLNPALRDIRDIHAQPDMVKRSPLLAAFDYLGALTKERVGWGHGKSYYKRSGLDHLGDYLTIMQGTEMMANHFAIAGSREQAARSAARLLQWLAPKTWAAMDQKIRGA